uniref:F-box domain-containing protein n=1 Tax=Brassica oleracea var. oleracea TaxID=109376 RepID=A0A0D3C619_BRAOL
MNIIINTDLLEELLVRLPLKSLVRFKSVSKEWKSILESKCFVEKHLNFQKSTPKILIAYNCDCGVSPTLLPESRLEEGEEFVFLHCDATRSSMSCDGLVCIPEEECVNVLNLSTGQLQRFHSPPLVNRRTNSTFTNGTWTTYFPGYYAMGFGREKVKGHYKVVRISGDPNYSDTLDVSTGEWRTLWKPRRYKVDVGRKSACVNGTIYWLRIVSHGVNGSVYSILALDLHTEKFHYVKHLHLPKGIVLEAHIVNVGDRLVIAMPERNFFGGVELGIWSMDAAQEETWSKTHSISIGIKPGVESRSFTPLSVYLPKVMLSSMTTKRGCLSIIKTQTNSVPSLQTFVLYVLTLRVWSHFSLNKSSSALESHASASADQRMRFNQEELASFSVREYM